ncbi:MAG: DUF1566 domain-containing protein [Deltaproteobacteria bacterium]|nr:DUF1566 domain-containing protein [Deltaproteobacteria bacterium]
MRKPASISQHKFSIFWFASFCIEILFFTSCGQPPEPTSDTGSIAFSVRFNGVSYEGPKDLQAMALDCDDAGVETVVAEIYDEASLYLTSGGPWLCSAHVGTIQGVLAGTNRTIVVLGKDINGNVLYRGETSGVTVTAGQTADAGTIEVEPFSPPFNPPTLISPTDGATVTSGSYSFEWESVTGASGYQIQVSTDSNFTSTVIDETLSTASYTPTTALSAVTYYWRVRAEESSGDQGAWSVVWSFTVSTEPGTAPLAPTNVSATAGDEEVTISWDSVSGATSYTIYWATYSGVSKADYEGVITGIATTSYTHTDLNNGTTYYYVVTAENSYGESDVSDEVSATPSSVGTAPSSPPNVTATAGDQEATISWDNVSEATSYHIYWATYTGVSKTDYEGVISDVTSPYTHTGLTNGTTYYYVVTAENSYGESDESGEVNATPLSTWTMLKLPDTGQTQSYTDVFGEDSDYTINPPSYTDNGDGTVTDNVTGLMWQQEDDDTTRTWADACSYCEDLTLAGYSDWRLPSKKELISIVDYGTYSPYIDATYFSSTNEWFYWCSTIVANDSTWAWDVFFGAGDVGSHNKSSTYYVRCVRGGEYIINGHFTDNGDATVTDGNTGLTWQQGEAGQMNWEDAICYCEDLSLAGYIDWRLPNIKELESITDDSLFAPAIDANFFPSVQTYNYFSSTTCNNTSSNVWGVGFDGGHLNYSNKSDNFYVRCVRGGQ